jgi:Ferritin-like domain
MGRRRAIQALGFGTAAGAAVLPAATSAQAAAVPAPKGPTDADKGWLVYAVSLELAAVGAYDIVLARTDLGLDEKAAAALHVFREHHEAYGRSIAALIGTDSPNLANATVVNAVAEVLSAGSLADVLGAAIALEDSAAATHVTILGQIESTDAARVIASIAPVEARHGVALRLLAKQPVAAPASGLDDLGAALNPNDYPIA